MFKNDIRIVGELKFNSTRKFGSGKKECFLCVSLTPGIRETFLVFQILLFNFANSVKNER